jgi:hypothetical protein
MTYVDFREVKRNVSIHQAAQLLHLDMHQITPGWYRAWCPRCEAHSIILTPLYNRFFCAKTGSCGDQILLYAHAKNTGVKEAAHRLGEFYGATILKGPPRQPAPQHGVQAQHGG